MVLYGTEYSKLKEKYKKILRQKTWYHGTTLSSIKSLEKPLVDYNKGNELDFCYGFYLAPDLEMAKRYIETMIGYKEELKEQFDFTDEELTPIVIEYDFSELIPEDCFNNLAFETACFPKYSEDFAKFILLNRLNPDKENHNYDLIFGVMSDSNPNILVPQVKSGSLSEEEFVTRIMEKTTSTKQLSVHNQWICDKLVMKAIHYVKEGVVRHVENIGQ